MCALLVLYIVGYDVRNTNCSMFGLCACSWIYILQVISKKPD